MAGTKLPYIILKIANQNCKFLVDTGANKSFFDPKLISDKYIKTISPVKISTLFSSTDLDKEINIRIKEFEIQEPLKFLAFKFHTFFDGLIGIDLLKYLKADIKLTNSILETPYTKINILYKENLMSKIYIVQPRSKQLVEIPVQIKNGDVYLKPHELENGLIIPEGVYTSSNHFIKAQVINYTPKPKRFSIEHPLPCDLLQKHADTLDVNICISEPEQEEEIDSLIRTEHLNSEENKAIRKLCRRFENIFQKENQDLTFTNEIKHNIDLTDNKPIFTKTYRYPFIHKAEVESQVNKMLTTGIIKPSFSPWSSPIWIVPKKADASGKTKWRMVIDYRKLNEKTIDDKYPIPNITDILDKLGKCQYFTTLDLASGFHQIEVNPKDREKTAFSVEFGHYEFIRMPFGLKNAPSTFQRVMDNVLGELQGSTCLCYMDDIIVFSVSLQEHIESLTKVFSKLEKANLKVQLDKSEFMHREVAFLGHIITPQGVKPNPNKIRAIKDYPLPTTEKQIKSFLGLLGYYRKFIKNFAKLTKPMTKFLRKNETINIKDPEYLKSFELAKEALTSNPLLQYPDFTQDFILTTDASNLALGAILSQGTIGQDLPICYASRTLTSTEQNYSTIEKELLAIVWATKYFRPYLFGRRFQIVTDHKPLTWLFSLKEPNSKLVRWRLKLEEFDYKIVYKKGTLNSNADALSRVEINNSESISSSSSENTAAMLSTPDNLIPLTKNSTNTFNNQFILYISEMYQEPLITKQTLFGERKRITLKLPKHGKHQTTIKKYLQEIMGVKHRLTCIFTTDEVFEEVLKIYYKMISQRPRKVNPKVNLVRSKIFLTDIENPEEQSKLIKQTHEFNEHRGISENYEQLKTKYYFPHLKEQIQTYINKCDICQRVKYDRQPPEVEMALTETPKKPLEIIHSDIFYLNKEPFLTVIDKFSKHGTSYAIREKTAKNIKESLKHYISIHGIPTKLIVDTELGVSNEIKMLTQKYNIQLHITTPYNSTGNSPVERFHSTLKELCTVIKLQEPDEDLTSIMTSAIIAYNNSIHSATKMTPFQLLNGHYHPRTPEFGTELEYAQNHREMFEQLCHDMYTKVSLSKEKLLEQRNKGRKKPIDVKADLDIYVKKISRGKLKPLYRRERIKENLNPPLLLTDKGKVHKAKVKRLFQVNNDPQPGNGDQRTDNQQGHNPDTYRNSSPVQHIHENDPCNTSAPIPTGSGSVPGNIN